MREPTPNRRSRPTRAQLRRRRALVWVAASAAIVAAIAVIGSLGSGGGSGSGPASRSGTSTGSVRKKLVAKRAPRPLPTPVSGEVVVSDPAGPLVIGGLDTSGSSASGIFRLNPKTGQAHAAGVMPQPLHDAAGVASGGQVLVFGGGTTTSTDSVEALTPGHDAQAVGHLPAPRSDLAAATIGKRAYVLGGYDGHTLSREVLATADGRTFSAIARLPLPVRYPAVATSGTTIFAFGGETTAGKPTDAIQAIDVASGGAHVVGHLPQPVDHAAAIALGGQIYVLGGSIGGIASDAIVAFQPSSGAATAAGHLPMPVSNAAATTVGRTGYLVGGVGAGATPIASIVTLRLRTITAPVTPAPSTTTTTSTTAQATTAPSSSAPFTGKLLIADRGNDRLLVVDSSKHVLWRYPSAGRPPPAGGFDFPDDGFFVRGGTGIITNQEENETIVEIGYPSGKVLWSYGHPGVIGSSPGYLHEPDDAYLLRDGTITVADAQNCRILFIDERTHRTSQVGTSGSCAHDPPRMLGSPNGDTPLPNGDILVSEVNGSWIDEITRTGHVVWSTQLPLAYPSDPQRLGPNRYLVADYTRPGGIYEFDRQGHIVWSYHPSSGRGMLDHPSLAERLPNGLIIANDDYRDRVVIIDPKTKRIVWQYGHTDQPGTGPDQLNTPDGLDLLDPSGATPTHPSTG